MKNFNELPLATQKEVKSVLCAYSTCTVEIDEKGSYSVKTFVALHNGTYNEIIGTYTKEGVFTEEEQILNYVNTFREFPYPQYKGEKDWKALNSTWTIATLSEKGNIVFN